MKRLCGFVVLAAVAAACSQPPPPPPPPPSTAIIASVRIPYEATKGFIMKTAEQVPEAKYAYQPTKEVRTLGQILAHIADANYLFCTVASTEKAPEGAGSAEKTAKTKADVQKALTAAFAYCDRAFAALNDQTGAAEAIIAPINNLKTTKIGALSFDAAHNYEHYGNLVTYMRINKMVPPSSQGGM